MKKLDEISRICKDLLERQEGAKKEKLSKAKDCFIKKTIQRGSAENVVNVDFKAWQRKAGAIMADVYKPSPNIQKLARLLDQMERL